MLDFFEKWSPQIADLAKSIAFTESYFGESWLRAQAEEQGQRPKDWHKKFTHHLKPEPHPILPIYLKARDNLRQLKKDSAAGFDVEALELISISDVLRAVRTIDVVDINSKLLPAKTYEKLAHRLRNKEDFHQALYEGQIAAALKKSGLAVCFVQESRREKEKTPDLLIRDGTALTYVECKYQAMTKREQQYGRIFNDFYWRVMRLMYCIGKFYSVCIEWSRDPTVKDILHLIDWIEKKMGNDEEGCFEEDVTKVWLKRLASRGQVFDGEFRVDISDYRSDDQHVDITMLHVNGGIFDGKVKHKNPTLVMFRSISYLDDVVDGIVEQLNKAYRQIPERGPGIVFLESRLSFLNTRVQESLEELQRRLEGKLNIVGRVNLIVLTRSHFVRQNRKIDDREAVVIARVVESRIVRNQKPASAIAKSIFDKICSLKYY